MIRITLLALAAATLAGPALAQDAQYEADRRRAELAQWGARADAQAAAAARASAQQSLVLQQTRPEPVQPVAQRQVLDQRQDLLRRRLELEAADGRAAAAELRLIDARLREIDAFLARQPRR